MSKTGSGMNRKTRIGGRIRCRIRKMSSRKYDYDYDHDNEEAVLDTNGGGQNYSIIICNDRHISLLLNMKYDHLLHLLGNQSCFDLASIVQLSEDNRESLKRQLCRWCKAGKIVPLRRGSYALAPDYRKTAVNPAELANQLYSPSYLSDTWALGFFGLIPERVVVYTSITSRGPKTFRNACGNFRYRHVKPEAFFGYRPMEISGRKVLLAEPEKALLDHWYLEKGEWNESRLSEMRLQNLEQVRCDKLIEYAARFKSPQLSRTADLYVRSIHRFEPEGVEL